MVVSTLTITRGLPGSGKTTWAKEQLGAARVNRDELRRMMRGGPVGENRAERQVTLVQHAAVDALLRADVNVICDDTNLRAGTIREYARIARDCAAEFRVRDFTDVPLEVCIERDAGRPEADRVGEDVIRGMWQRYFAGRTVPLPIPGLPAAAGAAKPEHRTGADRSESDLPDAVLVDIDGTVALMAGRGPHDMSRVGEDRPNHSVIAAVRAMHAAGHHIVYCSGRSDDARAVTEKWLRRFVDVPYEGLYMRAAGDTRRDSVVKEEIFEQEIRHRYRVVGVFDDRMQVVRMWRALGLTVFQVAEGDF